MTGTPSFRAISSGSSPKSLAVPDGLTRHTPRRLRPYPRLSTSNAIPWLLSHDPTRITNGVLPDPPTLRLPMLITGPSSRRGFSNPRSYDALRTFTPAPNTDESPVHISGDSRWAASAPRPSLAQAAARLPRSSSPSLRCFRASLPPHAGRATAASLHERAAGSTPSPTPRRQRYRLRQIA